MLESENKFLELYSDDEKVIRSISNIITLNEEFTID
jgi:hypothetical protein